MIGTNEERAIAILRENSFEEEANYLESLFEQFHSGDDEIRQKASIEIEGLCQVRSYGSLNIKTMNGWKWNSLLEKIAHRVRRQSK